MRTVWYVLFVLAASVFSPAEILHDDAATAALWHMDTVSEDETVTYDDDSQNAGRNRDLTLTYPGTNETPPTLTPGYDGNALLFSSNNIAVSDNFWSSSYTEFKLDGMPDSWETAYSLNINDPADRNYDPDGDGYTNLEDYLNSLVTTIP